MMSAPSLRDRLLMFDFLFKRVIKPTIVAVPPAAQSTTSTTQLARDAARAQAEKFTGDETACVDFLLLCEFADARLIAAQSIHTKEALQRAFKVVRNSDRRVARLMQSRLDALQHQHQVHELATHCIDEARTLITQPHLTAQKVGEIDRRWAALAAPPEVLQEVFNAARRVLSERLLQQAELQRGLIDTLTSLRRVSDRALHTVSAHSSADSSTHLFTDLERYQADIVLFDASTEAVNVPKNLLDQCKTAATAARDVLTDLQKREQQSAALITLLAQWEALPATSLDPALLHREWQRATGSFEVVPVLHMRWTALLGLVAANRPTKAKVSTAPCDTVVAMPQADHSPLFITALQALEDALAQGSLQHAQDADRQLRSISSGVVQTGAQTARLSRLRTQLSQLQSWARWGGNISREELQKAAHALPEQALTVVALAKKIGNLRQQWKALDATSGPASKELWQGFDAACTAAYAPVAEHHRVLDEARRINSAVAQQQISAIEQAADQLAAHEQPDWKTVAQLCQRAQQDWQRIGPTERRDRQALDRRFQTASQRLLQPLGEMQKSEQALREQLIASAETLTARTSGTLESVRTLQQQWQARANAVPLDRRTEQALWLRFRAACDAVFAQRKESAAADDQQRQANLHEREALCQTLEQSGVQSASFLTTLLRDSATAWSACGPVPRAAQQSIEKRYRQAVGVIKEQIDTLQRGLASAQKAAVSKKLQLCMCLESVVTHSTEISNDLVEQLCGEWKEITSITSRLDIALAHRFEQGLQAQRTSDQSYVQRLIANRVPLLNELLRLEIILSLESPLHLTRERLTLQVDVLQAALRDGQATGDNASSLVTLCALPAAIDTETTTRLEQVIERLQA